MIINLFLHCYLLFEDNDKYISKNNKSELEKRALTMAKRKI